jgi:ABC-type transport system substrate-binding protein
MARSLRSVLLVGVLLLLSVLAVRPAVAAPEGTLTWAVHISLAPTFFDPAETPGLITPFMVLYAIHDAVAKPMPGQAFAPSLAESWSTSKDGLTWEFALRKNVRFQWDPKSPWHDRRVRLAANLAVDREGINQASYLGLAKVTSSMIPSQMEYFWQPPAPRYDPAQAKKLLAEAGYPNGFDAGELSGDMIYGSAIGEPSVNYLNAVGIRVRLRLMERAAYYSEYGDKKLRGVLYTGSAAFGNAATRLENYVVGGGRYVYGSHPDMDGLFAEQVNETNTRVRQQILTKIQQMAHERLMFIPVMETAFLNGVGPRAEVHGLNVIPGFAYSAPYEDLKVKKK